MKVFLLALFLLGMLALPLFFLCGCTGTYQFKNGSRLTVSVSGEQARDALEGWRK